jgi:hypothetical protein
MACLSKLETRVDAHGVTTTRKLRESFSDFAPESNTADGLQGYTITQDSNGGPLYTVDEETIDSPGENHWSVEIGNSTEPIETNIRYSSAFNEDWQKEELKKWQIWKSNPGDPLVIGWDPSKITATGGGGTSSWAVNDLYNFWKQGITDYYEPKLTLKREIIETDPPNLDGLGLIQGASIYPGPANLGSRNFLYIGASGRQSGKWWMNTYEYVLSGPLGWNANLYSGTAGS